VGPLVVSIVGPGGIGKTALVVRWAHQIADRFPDGQLCVNLRGYGPETPMSMAAALEWLLRSFPVDPARVPPDIEERMALLRSLLSERRMLIVLDNAHDSAQVRPLLPGSACVVLVTSRSQLRGLTARDGAHRISLGPIGVEAASAVFAVATGRHASEFPADQVSDLIDVCAGLPLAIRIIAERLTRDQDAYDLTAVNTALRSRNLDELDSGDGDLTDMRAIVSWSYDALDEATSRAFQLLATHPGPDIGLPAATALLGRSPATTRRLLDRLSSVHLIEHRQQHRYAMHDLVRAYGLERSQHDGPDQQAIERLYDWYVHTAFNARDQLYPRPAANRVEPPGGQVAAGEFTDVRAAQDWFDLEYPALVAVADHTAGHGLEEHAWKMAWALWEYFYRRKLWDSWTASLEAGLAAARRCRSRTGEMEMLDGLGSIYWARGLWERSIELRAEALALARAEANRYREATILQNIGVSYIAGGDRTRSFEYLLQALGILNEFDDAPDRTMVLNNLGELLNGMGRHAEAIEYLSRSLADTKHSYTDRIFSSSVDNLGVALAGLGDHNGAIEQFKLALANNREYRYRFREALNLLHIGDSLDAIGDQHSALDHWKASLEIYTELGMPEADEARARIEEHGRPRCS
jgi:tetratricopeptide (TPR) repeat protein